MTTYEAIRILEDFVGSIHVAEHEQDERKDWLTGMALGASFALRILDIVHSAEKSKR